MFTNIGELMGCCGMLSQDLEGLLLYLHDPCHKKRSLFRVHNWVVLITCERDFTPVWIPKSCQHFELRPGFFLETCITWPESYGLSGSMKVGWRPVCPSALLGTLNAWKYMTMHYLQPLNTPFPSIPHILCAGNQRRGHLALRVCSFLSLFSKPILTFWLLTSHL